MTTKFIAIISIFIYMLISAFQSVYLSQLLQDADIFPSITFIFFIVAIFFTIINDIKKNASIPSYILKKGILYINIITLVTWISFFIAIKYLEPAIVSALCLLFGPFFTFLVNVKQKNIITQREKICSIGILICTFFIIIISYSGLGGIIYNNKNELTIAIMMSIICGLSISLNTICSKKINQPGISPEQILSFRFILLIVVALVLSGFEDLVETISLYYFQLSIIAVVGNIIPLYFIQLGISKTTPMTVSLLLVFNPLIYFIVQQFSDRTVFSYGSIGCIIFSSIFVIFSQKDISKFFTRKLS